MPITVREIRIDELDQALAFASEQGCEAEAARVTPSMSLIALEGEATRGVLLTVTGDDDGHEMELVVDDTADHALCKTLLDTALLKMRSQHISKSRVRLASDDPAAALALWSSANWTPGSITPGSPAPGNPAPGNTDASESIESQAQDETSQAA